MRGEPIEILLVEDNPGDIELTKEAFREGKLYHTLHVVQNGTAALNFLRHEGPYSDSDAPRPDVILLDLNLPGKNGRQVLAEIKADQHLQTIPVIVLTTSAAERDILMSYKLHANSYIVKPVDVQQFFEVVRALTEYWFTLVKLPPKE
jgi:chemotaxis family two-component system response regulator Rcp1